MATNPVSTTVSTNPADQQLDDHSGVYGFFRRHQKKLLYTAGLFTLLTFSVTGPMMTAVGSIFDPQRDLPTIAVGGQRVQLEPLDFVYGTQIARNMTSALPLGVLPPLGTGEGGSNELAEVLAILRRAAITEGVDVSMAEVDRAIEAFREMTQAESAARLAGYRGFPSLAAYREIVREAMLIGTYVRLQTLALDCSDAEVLEQVISDKERITFRTASFDEKAAEERIKAATTPTDDELRAWLDGKTEFEKMRLQVFDSNHLELRFGALLLAEGQFDASQWTEVLKDFQPAEDQLRLVYDSEKEQRFKIEGSSDYKPFEDVQAELTRLLQADQVIQYLNAEIRKRFEAAMKVPTEELQRCQTEAGEAKARVQELEQQLAGKPEDAAAIEEQIRLAKETVAAKEAAVTAATEAVKVARESWDFPAAFAELTAGKSGFEQKAMTGRRSIEQLKDLAAAGIGYGDWVNAAQARGITAKGDIGSAPGRARDALLLYQATDVLVRPLKPWETLKPLLEGAFFTEKAKAEGEAKQKLMQETLLRLAKEKMPEKVQEIEGKRATRVDERLAEWRRTTEAGIAEARNLLEKLEAGTQAQAAWQRKLDRLTAVLAEEAKQRTQIETEVGQAIDEEIAAEAKKHYGEVLEAAANEAGFTLSTTGPYPRDLASRPRFDKAHDEITVFLFSNHAELEAGATTGVVQDATNRRWLVAVCDKVEPLDAGDATRRDFEAVRTGNGLFAYSTLRSYQACGQAFTLQALEKRYDVQRTVGKQEVQ